MGSSLVQLSGSVVVCGRNVADRVSVLPHFTMEKLLLSVMPMGVSGWLSVACRNVTDGVRAVRRRSRCFMAFLCGCCFCFVVCFRLFPG